MTKVVPIKPGATEASEPYIDTDLIERLETLLEAAREGRVKSFLDITVLDDKGDSWYWAEDEWQPVLAFYALRFVNTFATSLED
jgi:hypothetical protein